MIVNSLLETLRQGVWASLTGGWFYDPKQTACCNIIHFYLWLFLVFFPLILHFTIGFANYTTIAVYAAVSGLLFLIIKIISWQFHVVFDTYKAIERNTPLGSHAGSPSKRSTDTIPQNGIEMDLISHNVIAEEDEEEDLTDGQQQSLSSRAEASGSSPSTSSSSDSDEDSEAAKDIEKGVVTADVPRRNSTLFQVDVHVEPETGSGTPAPSGSSPSVHRRTA